MVSRFQLFNWYCSFNLRYFGALGILDFGYFGLGYFGTVGILGLGILGQWVFWAWVFWGETAFGMMFGKSGTVVVREVERAIERLQDESSFSLLLLGLEVVPCTQPRSSGIVSKPGWRKELRKCEKV